MQSASISVRGKCLLNVDGKIACLGLLGPGINQVLRILGWAVVESTRWFPLNDPVYQVPRGADGCLMIDAVGVFPPGLSTGTLLKGNEIISGPLVAVRKIYRDLQSEKSELEEQLTAMSTPQNDTRDLRTVNNLAATLNRQREYQATIDEEVDKVRS
ncbi:hypothetical protein E2C01_042914 [Portunus trituberculatus]|uniref:Uncharacterized protein n=1 Tax=Portunus trituberculatus TaxID=210409 RepID=A0A5B7FW16_PORTR|nr:hypothetical protein [Portunus trituberculatus]